VLALPDDGPYQWYVVRAVTIGGCGSVGLGSLFTSNSQKDWKLVFRAPEVQRSYEIDTIS